MKMKGDDLIINTKQLRQNLARIVRQAREGKRYLVLHRSRPAFALIPPPGSPVPLPPLEKDPLFRLGALGKSTDGLTAADHDRLLYGK